MACGPTGAGVFALCSGLSRALLARCALVGALIGECDRTCEQPLS